MKSAKKKLPKPKRAAQRTRTELGHAKAALRSDAFARAVQRAHLFVNDRDRLHRLVEEAAKKAASVPKEPFGENWAYLQTMLRFTKAYYRNQYSGASENALLPIIAALNYLMDPFDLIPDEVPFLGFVDDAAVVEFAVLSTKRALDDFMIWETCGD